MEEREQRREHTLGVQTDGSLWAWGSNTRYQLGSAGSQSNVPRHVGTATDWSTVGAGGDSSLAITTDGSVFTWADNTGSGTGTSRQPKHLLPGTTWSSCSVVDESTFCIRTDGTLWAWGGNFLGNGDVNHSQLTPIQIGTDTSWKVVAGGRFYSAGLQT